MRVKEEAQLAGKLVHVESGRDGSLDVVDAVGQRKCNFLGGRAARLADVVPADRDRVPLGNLGSAVAEDVGDQPHRWGRREDVGAARNVLLEHIILNGAAQRIGRYALLLADGDHHCQQDGRGCVDGHADADLVKGNAVEQGLHIAQTGDRHADLAYFAFGKGMVGIITDLRRQVEGNRKAGLPLGDQELIALIALLGVAKAGVLAHGPETAAVHVGLHATRVGEFAGEAKLLLVRVDVAVSRHVDDVHLHILAAGSKFRLPLGVLFELRGQDRFFPMLFKGFELLWGHVNHIDLHFHFTFHFCPPEPSPT